MTMEFLQDQALAYLRSSSFFSSSSSFSSSSPSRPSSLHQQVISTLQTYLIGPLATLLSSFSSSSSSPSPSSSTSSSTSSARPTDLLTLVIGLATVFLFLQLANYIRRLVLWWVGFGLRVALVYGLLLLGWNIWTRGVEQTARDLGWLAGWVEALVAWGATEMGLLQQHQQHQQQQWSRPGGGGYGGTRNGYHGYAGGREQVPVPTRRRAGWG